MTLRKLILLPTLIIAIPQALVAAFFGFARAVLGPSHSLNEGWVVCAGVVLLFSAVPCLVWFFAEWFPEYELEQARLREKREQELAKLEQEIGIPRIPSVRR